MIGDFWTLFVNALLYSPARTYAGMYRTWSTYNSMGTNPINPIELIKEISNLPAILQVNKMKQVYYIERFANIAQIKIPVLQQLAFNRLQEEINQLKTA